MSFGPTGIVMLAHERSCREVTCVQIRPTGPGPGSNEFDIETDEVVGDDVSEE